MRPRDLAALEFYRVCSRVADFAVSPAGKEACHDLRPAGDPDVADLAIEQAWQCFRLLERFGDLPLRTFPDLRPHLRTAAHEGFVLDGRALVEVRGALAVLRDAGTFLRRHTEGFPALVGLVARLPVFPSLEASLGRALDEDGNVLDQASDELAAVRAHIRRLRATLSRRLEDLVSRPGMADVVADDYVTLRNNRFVVPIRTAAASRINGVVQDRSISGETLFVEPLFAVELNNELLMAVREEDAIVRRILADLTGLVRTEHVAVHEAIEALVAVDCLTARAKFGRAYRCVRPSLSDGDIELREARHAGLLFTEREVTPIDLVVPADKRVFVVTGPNTGGKTVALKTLALCALMSQSGIPIPAAEGARLPHVSAIFTDIGDEQNIERDLSTFSAHVANLCEILASDAKEPWILLDEPGVGTDPEEGAALAIGLIQHLERRGARVVMTTHYTPVKQFALARQSCLVSAVDFDVETLTPRYQLTYNSLGRSLALPIAQRLGLPEEILVAARAAQSESSQSFSAALEELEKVRRRLERELAGAETRAKEFAARDEESRRLLDEARERRRDAWNKELHEARDFVRDTKAEGRELLRKLQHAVEERSAYQKFVQERQDAIATHTAETAAVSAPQARSFGPLQVGDYVELADQGIRGELLSVDGDRAWIQRGSLRFEVPAAQLGRVSKKELAAPVRVNLTSDVESARNEISLIGLRARQALAELEQFLDRAAQARLTRVRIVHGFGSGALRRAVQDYLSSSPYCSEFRNGSGDEGGGAVTVVELNV
jgi:DNA mismatch repair protein MutS2